MSLPRIKARLIRILSAIRAPLVRCLRPRHGYRLFSTNAFEPLSNKFGFDRGTPIDRYYIETFLKKNAQYIKGECLEIHDTAYIDRFGTGVTKKDALDIDTSNTQATLYGDLRSLPHIATARYDCVVLTHTLGVIDDLDAAVQECLRIVKPGGHILVTVSALGVAQEIKYCYWRFTTTSLTYLFEKYAGTGHCAASAYGNIVSGQAFWVGMAAEELTPEERAHHDERYAVIVAAVVTK